MIVFTTIGYLVLFPFICRPMDLLALRSLEIVFMILSPFSPITCTISSAYANIARYPYISIFQPLHTSLIAFYSAKLNLSQMYHRHFLQETNPTKGFIDASFYRVHILFEYTLYFRRFPQLFPINTIIRLFIVYEY